MNNDRTNLPTIEKSVIDFWQQEEILAKVIDARRDGKPFVFYDGPPFANGRTHYGHICMMAIKDAVLRYKTMHGYNVPRKMGWDTHGLPVEYELEKELKLSGKREIEAYGIEKFVEAARASVLRYADEWKHIMQRMGRWLDLEHPYTTMDPSYIESVWWAFNTLHDKGLVYEDFRVSPYCPRCGTVLSNFEVNQGYQDNVADPSVYASLPLKTAPQGLEEAELVIWTTTPWTLPSNVAVALNPQRPYAVVPHNNGRRLIVDADRVAAVFGDDVTVQTTLLGQELLGHHYEPFFALTQDANVYQVIDGGEAIAENEGTGLVHIAPAYGETDFSLRKAHNLPLVQSVEPDGTVTLGRGLPGEGTFVKKADKAIIENLEERKRLVKAETIHHTYPFCWRCDSPLLYYPATSWFVKVTELKDRLVEANRTIRWQPSHIQEGRFGQWLEGARDWAISRDRYWGAPLPVWQCQKCDKIRLVKSRSELDVADDFDLHRPYIDSITLDCECGGIMKRVPYVFDCWFESGSMPFAQHHYPFNPAAPFDPHAHKGYPADFIAEALDQTRGWFYTLHVLGLGLFNEKAYRNVVVSGLILASDGKKLSKRLRNYTDPEVLFDEQGVDALRLFLFTSTSLGEDYRFSDANVNEVKRRWLVPLLNVLNYYQLSQSERDDLSETEPSAALLDRWIKARLYETKHSITAAMEGDETHSPFDLVRACRTFGPFVEDLSTWYVRLSRGRKDPAFTATLREILEQMSLLFAPFLPFLMEHLYQAVREEDSLESVHLRLQPDLSEWENPPVLDEMAAVRTIVSLGRELRAKAGIAVRQPLATLEIRGTHELELKLSEAALALIGQELQVESVALDETLTPGFPSREEGDVALALDTRLTPELQAKGEANMLRRTIQDLRKQANLQPGDEATVTLSHVSDSLQKLLVSQLNATTILDTTPSTNPLVTSEVQLSDGSTTINLYAPT